MLFLSFHFLLSPLFLNFFLTQSLLLPLKSVFTTHLLPFFTIFLPFPLFLKSHQRLEELHSQRHKQWLPQFLKLFSIWNFLMIILFLLDPLNFHLNLSNLWVFIFRGSWPCTILPHCHSMWKSHAGSKFVSYQYFLFWNSFICY